MSKNQIKILMTTIDLLRIQLQELINESDLLTEQEIIKKSRELDQLIVRYYELLKKVDKS